jgi:hypothetical protein
MDPANSQLVIAFIFGLNEECSLPGAVFACLSQAIGNVFFPIQELPNEPDRIAATRR